MDGITYSGSDEKSESLIRIPVMFLTLGIVNPFPTPGMG